MKSAALTKSPKWHADRATAIGGSDAHHLLGLEPYGCCRRLHYEKAGVEADFPEAVNFHMERGTRLEDVAADVYAEETGRTLRKIAQLRHPRLPFMAANVDRLISCPDGDPYAGRGDGVMEIKVPTLQNWYRIKATGLNPSAFVQSQWGMAVSQQLCWGSVAVFSPEYMRCLVFDCERDDEICKDFEPLATEFWTHVAAARKNRKGHTDNPYPLLDDGDRRCVKCPWRKRCKGLGAVPAALSAEEQADVKEMVFARDTSHDPLMAEYFQLKELLAEAKRLFEAAEKKVKERLKDAPPTEGDGYLAYWKTIERSGYTVAPGSYKQLRVIPKRGATNEH